MPWYETVPALVGAICLGWIGGLATFRQSLRWCTTCGRTLTCAACARISDYQPARARTR